LQQAFIESIVFIEDMDISYLFALFADLIKFIRLPPRSLNGMKNTGEERINTYFMTVRLQEFINSIQNNNELLLPTLMSGAN
jgi:hypothetical protein